MTRPTVIVIGAGLVGFPPASMPKETAMKPEYLNMPGIPTGQQSVYHAYLIPPAHLFLMNY